MRKLLLLFAVLGLLAGACADLDEATDTVEEELGDQTPDAIDTETETTETEPPADDVTEAAEEPPPAFSEPISLSGSGDDLVSVDIPEDSPAIAHIVHEGQSNIQVTTFDEDGQRINGIVNEIGNYDGIRPLNFERGEAVAEFEIAADGAWTIEVSPITSARMWSPSTPIEGDGDEVVLADGVEGAAMFTHDGGSNFQVTAWGDSRDGLINEIGTYDGTVRVPAGTLLVEIVADGTWTAEVR